MAGCKRGCRFEPGYCIDDNVHWLLLISSSYDRTDRSEGMDHWIG